MVDGNDGDRVAGRLHCPRCGRALEHICGIVIINPAGNEESFDYFRCASEDLYFVDVLEDAFMSDEFFTAFYEMEAARAMEDIELALSCPDRANKYCICSAHCSGHRFG